MTLDRMPVSAIKGHPCSLLISNIDYPLFLSLSQTIYLRSIINILFYFFSKAETAYIRSFFWSSGTNLFLPFFLRICLADTVSYKFPKLSFEYCRNTHIMTDTSVKRPRYEPSLRYLSKEHMGAKIRTNCIQA